MGNSNEWVVRLAEVGLLVFVGIFLVVIWYAFSRRNRATFERASRLPLENDKPSDDHPGVKQVTGKA